MKINSKWRVFLVLSFFSCTNAAEKDNPEKQKNDFQAGTIELPVDSLELFFHSKGVLVFDAVDSNLVKTFQILNEDNTVFATLNLSLDEIIIKSRKFSRTEFAKDNSLRTTYHFFPKEFYSDYSGILQFEYTGMKDSIVEIFLDKEHQVKKHINLNSGVFKLETWEKHLLGGAMFVFDANTNPIRESCNDRSRSLGYEIENEIADKDYIFEISEILGDWIKIECFDRCDTPCTSGKNYDGWIKWKNGNKLLISLRYAC